MPGASHYFQEGSSIRAVPNMVQQKVKVQIKLIWKRCNWISIYFGFSLSLKFLTTRASLKIEIRHISKWTNIHPVYVNGILWWRWHFFSTKPSIIVVTNNIIKYKEYITMYLIPLSILSYLAFFEQKTSNISVRFFTITVVSVRKSDKKFFLKFLTSTWTNSSSFNF